MPRFEGKVRIRGNRIKGVQIQARNRDEAFNHIKKMGKVITFRRSLSFDINQGMSSADRQIFFNRLSAMLASRVGTSDALALIRDTFTGKIQEVAARTLNYVESGDDLAQALERVGSPDFPVTTVALIKAGSRSGETWRAIKDAAEFEYQMFNIRKGASKGLVTGVLSFIGAGILTVVSTLYFGPKIMESDLIKAANRNGAVNIDWINNIAYATGYTMAFILFVAVLMVLLAFVGRRVAPESADKLIMKIPYYKDLVLARNNFIVLYELSLLIKSGVRIRDALKLSAESAPKGALKSDLVAAEAAVNRGRDWATAMKTLHPTDKAALRSAVDREQIAATLDALASQYRELYGQRIASFVPIVQLLAALFLTIAGGLIFGQTIMPMLMATQALL